MKTKQSSTPDIDYEFGHWPSGSTHLCHHIHGHTDYSIILGWEIRGKFGEKSKVWLATEVGYRQGRSYVDIDPMKDYEYLGEYAPAEIGGTLLKAFEKEHKIKYTFKE